MKSRPSSVDVVAFGAHPDDIELGCGGTLAKLAAEGQSLVLVDLTEGEMGTRGTVAERYRESADAAALLGAVERVNLQLPDAGITLDPHHIEAVVSALRRFRPQIVFAPYPADRHPDHVHASDLVSQASFYAGLRKFLPGIGEPHRPRRVVYYMMTFEFTPSFLVDISSNFEQKMAAVRAHRSQFHNPDYPGEQTFISSPEYIESVENRARYHGFKGGVTYAEPFWVREPLVLGDLFHTLTRNKM